MLALGVKTEMCFKYRPFGNIAPIKQAETAIFREQITQDIDLQAHLAGQTLLLDRPIENPSAKTQILTLITGHPSP